MKLMHIEGGRKLSGTIKISGAKNSSVALIPASILADGDVTIVNVPDVTDTDVLCHVLEHLGADVRRSTECVVITPTIKRKDIPAEQSKKLRASYYFMGALLGKFNHVEMYFPGGCSIGARPIDLHIKGFEALGAKATIDGDKYVLDAPNGLKGANIYLDKASVGATINIMLASVLASGRTVIDNAAKEPEIVNVATFLNSMGAKIKGAGTSVIKIDGVDKLNGCFHEVIPDRIETGTYMIMGALLGEDLKLYNVIPEHVDALIHKLKEMGADIEVGSDYIVINGKDEYKPTSIKTLVYPGFPTDLQQPFSPVFSRCKGISTIEETIFENRFMHLDELNKMGMKCTKDGTIATFEGPNELIGTDVSATDLRAGASLVVAGLAAKGTTTIHNVEHILRGYEGIVDKLLSVGAKITIDEVEDI